MWIALAFFVGLVIGLIAGFAVGAVVVPGGIRSLRD